MFKKLLLISFLLFPSPKVTNGYYQTTTINIEGINEKCYGTLLSDKTISGSFSLKTNLDQYVDDNIKNAFRQYKDKDNFFYLSFIQDVSEGLLYWPLFPPEHFKLLIYFPDSNTFIASDIVDRYCLNSTFKAVVNNNQIIINTNYNYSKLFSMTLTRIIISVLLLFIVCLLYGKPRSFEFKYILLSSIIVQSVIHIGISIYSFKNGFSIVEYYLFFWMIYLVAFVIQGYIYQKKTMTMHLPFMCSFISNIVAYASGIILVDVFPRLFTLI